MKQQLERIRWGVWILWLLSIQTSALSQIQQDFSFGQLTTEDGLSHNQISSFYEDKYGFLWIGTFSGLSKYDGYSFRTFYRDVEAPITLLNNTILWIHEGPEGLIWINTGEGISIYDPVLERFEDPAHWIQKIGASGLGINKIVNDDLGNSWFVLNQAGIRKYDQSLDTVFVVSSSPSSYIEVSSNDITDAGIGPDDDIWVVHRKGIVEVIDTKLNQVIRKFELEEELSSQATFKIFVDSDKDIWIHSTGDELGVLYVNSNTGERKILDENLISSRLVRDVIQDTEGRIWLGTDHGGISIVDKGSWEIRTLKHQPNKTGSLTNNSITALYRSKNGMIWVGKPRNGVSFYNENAGRFMHYKFDSSEPAFNDITSVVQDSKGDLWIGTNGNGLLRFDMKSGRFQESKILTGKHSSIGSSVVVSMNYATDQSLWIGTYLTGLFRYRNGRLIPYQTDSKSNSVSGNSIWDVYEDSDGKIWIGTLQNGLDRFDPQTGTFINFNTSNGLSVNYVTQILEDDKKQLWIATGNGLNKFDMATGKFSYYFNDDSVSSSISNNSVVSLLNDSRGNLWVGTMGGLNLYNPTEDGFTVLEEKDGLSSNLVMAILEDGDGSIWTSTSKGISRIRFEQGKPEIQTFDISDGLQGDNYNEGAALKTSNGMLIFAGQNGFNMFDPKSIVINDRPPALSFTNFYLNSEMVDPGESYNERMILEKNLNETERIELRYDENSFAFEFVALTYDQVGKNKYQYQLEGFDSRWVDAPSDIRRANYTNLDYGSYRFKVRAANNHNTWNNEGIFVDVVISPPFWKTPLAYVAYFLILTLILYLTRQAIISRERLKAKIENERLHSQRLHELDLMKIKFFTNISHEFKTPISLVLTPIQRMIKSPDNVKVGDFHLIERNAKRLLTLVNQLLDFRKMEANQHKLHKSSGDLVKFVRHAVESFLDMSREKEVELELDTQLDQYFTQFDKDKMDKILFNLLSNAFKFTFPGGKIIVDIERTESGDGIVISVTDTGIGIPEDKQNVIFDRFMQSEIKEEMVNSGSGIGLSITKEFVELHGGTISVESVVDHGSVFSVEMPLQQLSKPEETDKRNDEELFAALESIDIARLSENDKPMVFLVEDNADFRFYLKDNLKQYYNVAESYNGKEAWKSIVKVHPDIVICDVMMPVMNGLELCTKIKNDPRTSDIPVILLTAHSSDEHKIQGLEAGAIEYISKPFNFEILVSTINSALKFQKRVNQSKQKIEVEPSEVEIISRDEKLIQDALELVEKNISNSEFSVEEMSHELGYSRGHLYQKMVKITGQTPMDFIRNIRMKRATEYLRKSQMTVSEVAYSVGYNNPKLFSRYFKSVYKMYPSEYMNNNAGPE